MGIDWAQYFTHDNLEWDVKDLWKYSEDIEPEEICINDIHLSTMDDDFDYNIIRVKTADMKFPILLTPEGYVADGMHRVLNVILSGGEKILAKKFTKMPEPVHIIVERTKVY